MPKKNIQFAVLGLGRFGQSIVTTLSKNGCNVLACDKDEYIVQEMSEVATHVVQVDVTDEHALHSLGLGNFDVVIVAIGGDMQASVIATLVAKELGAKFVLAKALNNQHKTILNKIGADKVLLPEWDMGQRTAINLISDNIIDYINFSDEYSIAEMRPFPEWINNSIQTSNIRSTVGLNVVAIKRDGKTIISPKPTEIIHKDDVVVVLGDHTVLQKISSFVR